MPEGGTCARRPSRTWDRLGLPLRVGAESAGAFLYATQREMFDATPTVLGGLTAALPVVFRMVWMIADRRPPRAEEAKT